MSNVPNYDKYISCIKRNLKLEKKEMFFKNHPDYNYVTEHVTPEQGRLFLGQIIKEFESIFAENFVFLKGLCFKNDSIGKPKVFPYTSSFSCSPSNFRYIYQSFLILSYIKKSKLNDLNFIEIGGGYGGLYFFIHNLAPLYNIKISSYSVFDLEAAALLQKKYLDFFKITCNIERLDQSLNLKKNSFLISNYAFSEISKKNQKKYLNQVIEPFTSRGFMVWNGDRADGDPKFTDSKEFVIEDERPQTSSFPSHYLNKFLYFKQKEA
jgi:hypothetical protein